MALNRMRLDDSWGGGTPTARNTNLGRNIQLPPSAPPKTIAA